MVPRQLDTATVRLNRSAAARSQPRAPQCLVEPGDGRDAGHMANEHERLKVFLGDWWAEGTAYGADLEGAPWRSVHNARRHSGDQFVIQDERANGPFHTVSFLGWDQERGTFFSWSVENHGFNREYLVTVDDDTWTLTGGSERATITFSDGGRTQTHHWEFRPNGEWITLCDRVAHRVDD
jgi:hypothetical protein